MIEVQPSEWRASDGEWTTWCWAFWGKKVGRVWDSEER